MKLYIDGNSVFSKHWYGPQNSEEPLADNYAVFGTLNHIKRLIKEHEADELALAWDSQRSVRKEQYPAYKQSRKPKPEDYYEQLKNCQRLMNSAGFCSIKADGYEGDDVIATLSWMSWGCIVVTGDRDLLQLVSDTCSVYLMLPRDKDGNSRDTMVENEADVIAQIGVKPSLIPQLKGLMGDNSDNIPGVVGVGAGKAVPLIVEYQFLEAVFAALDGLPKKKDGTEYAWVTKIREQQDNALLSRWLAELKVIDMEVIDKSIPAQADIQTAVNNFSTLPEQVVSDMAII